MYRTLGPYHIFKTGFKIQPFGRQKYLQN